MSNATMSIFDVISEMHSTVEIMVWSEGECTILIIDESAVIRMQICDRELPSIVSIHIDSICKQLSCCDGLCEIFFSAVELNF